MAYGKFPVSLDGYAMEFNGAGARVVKDENWDTVMLTGDLAYYAFQRLIDGTKMEVFQSKKNKNTFWAVLPSQSRLAFAKAGH